jgi:hypothetical protein
MQAHEADVQMAYAKAGAAHNLNANARLQVFDVPSWWQVDETFITCILFEETAK